jgi:S-methylmethionine-dependent homocysteine/selenocysteine methylase
MPGDLSAFERALESHPVVLTDGGIETEIMFRTAYEMDPDLQVGAMVLDAVGEELLRNLYGAYVGAAEPAGLPIVIGTPTFRASANFAAAAGREGAVTEINRAAVAMHRQLADAATTEVLVAGVLGPARDAYTPADALDVDTAHAYHRAQARDLAEAGADFLFAATFPAIDEAVGAGRAMTDTGRPVVVSLVLGSDGVVLDGTSLEEAVARLDDEVAPAPVYISLSCIHTTTAGEALAETPDHTRARIRELKANGSPRPTSELVRLHHLESDPPDVFAERIWTLHERFGLQVIGGCCGTEPAHIAALAELIRAA